MNGDSLAVSSSLGKGSLDERSDVLDELVVEGVSEHGLRMGGQQGCSREETGTTSSAENERRTWPTTPSLEKKVDSRIPLVRSMIWEGMMKSPEIERTGQHHRQEPGGVSRAWCRVVDAQGNPASRPSLLSSHSRWHTGFSNWQAVSTYQERSPRGGIRRQKTRQQPRHRGS